VGERVDDVVGCESGWPALGGDSARGGENLVVDMHESILQLVIY
jgi:hypothetical protein